MTSPYLIHRDKVLGYSRTAGWLRSVVMALRSASAQPVGLSNLWGVDEEHFEAFIDMVTHYRREGGNDPALRQLCREIEARMAEDTVALHREQQFRA